MPMYEYRCRTCGAEFESLRPAADADAPASCPAGHVDAVRRLSLVAPVRGGDGAASGGACCAGGCACGRN